MESLQVLMFVALFIALAAAGEPRCSKFDYDEKTLEKMIRTEIKCEAVLADVKNFKELVKEEMEKVKAEKTRMEQEIQTALAEVAVERKKMKDEIQTADEALKPTVVHVSFKAKMTASVTVNQGDALVFQDVVSNYGNGYDAAKGMFRAPVGGLFLFTLQICVPNNHYFVLETVIDDIAVSHARMSDQTYNQCYDHTDLVTLAANSIITFRSGSSSRSTVTIHVDSTHYTTFIAGVLLVKQ